MSNNRMLDKGIAGSKGYAWLKAWLPSQHCLLCQADSGNALLCPACTADLPAMPDEICPICALPVVGHQVCGPCLSEPPFFDRTLCGWTYDFPVDTLIQSLKYGHQLTVAHWLGERLTQLPRPLKADLLLPMPLSPGHLQERGFNQAVEIARPLARRWQLPLALSSCERIRETRPQTSLPWKLRQKNVRGAFECRQDLTGKHVLVLDDVMTTGATLNELARTLKKHGAASVTNLVCARALKH